MTAASAAGCIAEAPDVDPAEVLVENRTPEPADVAVRVVGGDAR